MFNLLFDTFLVKKNFLKQNIVFTVQVIEFMKIYSNPMESVNYQVDGLFSYIGHKAGQDALTICKVIS